MKSLAQFIADWLGKRIDYDHVYKFQCVDLILEYIYECFGIASGVHGNAINYWTITSAPLVAKFNKIQTSAAQAGDIVVFKTVGHTDFLGDGHIGIATGNINATQVEVLEQNGHGGLAPNTSGDGLGANLIRTRWIDRARVAGVLRPIPVPAAPAPEVHPYTIEGITPKQVRINKETHLWGLTYDNFTAINANPNGVAHQGDIKTVVAILHHAIGYSYYLEDVNNPAGYNVQDCDDYTPPAPEPAPVVEAPAPVYSLPSQSPAGAYRPPSSETYEVVKTIPGYLTSSQAVNNDTPKVDVPADVYYVYNKRFTNTLPYQLIALNLTKTADVPGAWINPLDNAPDPDPEEVAAAEAAQKAADDKAKADAAAAAQAKLDAMPDWQRTYLPFPADKIYVAMKDLSVADIEGNRKNVTMPRFSVTKISGSFMRNGIEYARPRSAVDRDWWYGIEFYDRTTEESNIELESEVYDDSTTKEERKARGMTTMQDRWDTLLGYGKEFLLAIKQIFVKLKK